MVGAAAGCTARYPGSPTPTPTLARIQLHYSNSHVFISPGGATASLILYAVNTEGVYENVSGRASWFSTDTGVMEVVTNGSVRAVTNGSADLIANYQGLSASARIVVRSATPNLNFNLPSTVEVGDTWPATARLGFGTARTDVTDRCTWTSSNPAIVTAEGGRIAGRAPGTAAITVRLDASTSETFYISIPPIRSLP